MQIMRKYQTFANGSDLGRPLALYVSPCTVAREED